MARRYTAAGRQVHCGMVYAKINHKGVYRQRYLKATCGGVENEPAKLHLFKDARSAARGISSLLEISFAKVDHVKADHKDSITITYSGNLFCFYADRKEDHKMWMEYCFLLNSIPNYSIPEEPKHTHKSKFTEKYDDNANIWTVFIVDNGVGHDRECRGFHIIDLSTKDKTISKFRILNVYTEKCLHTWNKNELRISGRIGCLVYVEVIRLGLLWMYCANSAASEVSKCIHKFLYDQPQSSTDESTRSLDSGISSLRESPDLTSIDNSAQLCNTLASTPCLSSNGQRSSFDHDFERSLSLDDDSDAYYTAHSDENDGTFFDSGYFQLNQEPDNCNASIRIAHVSNSISISSPAIYSPVSIPTCYENSCRYCSCCTHCKIRKRSCGIRSSSVFIHSEGMSPSISSTEGLIESRSKRGCICRLTCCQCKSYSMTFGTEEKQKKALQKNCPVLMDKIDIGALLPHLITMDMLTDDDKEILMNIARIRTDKIYHLIDVLPRKAFGWFDNFLECLQQSTSGTGHTDIIKLLSITYDLLLSEE